MSIKKYRFFYHYNKANNGMTVHFRGVCYPCKHVRCNVPSETKWNKTQPRLVMQGFCEWIAGGGTTEDRLIDIL